MRCICQVHIAGTTIRHFQPKPSMPVNVLNLPGLRVLDFKETDTDYHVKAAPTIVSKLCPHCGRSNETVAHAQKTLFMGRTQKTEKIAR